MISKFAFAGSVAALSVAGVVFATAGTAVPAVTAVTPAAGAPVGAAVNYKVDPVHSYVMFKIKHDNIGSNYGSFVGPTGSFSWSGDSPESSSLDISVRSESVSTGNSKRDDHLKSGDFFDAKQFPTISFKSKSAKKLDGGKIEFTGDLTLLGKSKSVTVVAAPVGQTEKGAGIETTFTIKRTDFGMSKMTDRLSDEVTLTVALEGGKQ